MIIRCWCNFVLLYFADIEQQHHFVAGYNECAREVQMYLLRSNEVTPQVKARMLSHIATSPQDSNPRQSMNYTPKRDESSFKSKTSFTPLISVYPSPPASPIGMGHSRLNLNSPMESHEISWTSSSYSNESGSIVNNIEKKDISNNHVNQELWRPWQIA